MLSLDLAALYGVQPKALVQAVKRNIDRFPQDFMFQLSDSEFRPLKSQFVSSSWDGLRRAAPVFDAIRNLMEPPATTKQKQIGFRTEAKKR